MPRQQESIGAEHYKDVTQNCPCDVCPLAVVCSERELSCPRFSHWTETGKFNKEKSLALPVPVGELLG